MPASATHRATTGDVDRRETQAGTPGESFVFSVRHGPAVPGDTPPKIDHVAITAPPTIVPTGGSAPGWTVEVAGATVVFRTASAGIGAGGVGAFTVQGDVGTVPADTTAAWSVVASSDGGATRQDVQPSFTGSLSTLIRLLRVRSVALAAPAGVVDGSASGSQTVCARVRIANGGSEPKAVTVTVGGSFTLQLSAAAAAEPPCSGEAAPVAPAGGETDADVSLRFSDVAVPVSPVLTAQAQGEGASGFPGTAPVQLQPRGVLAALAGSLTPRSVKPDSEITIGFATSKGPAGSPALSLVESTRVSVPGCGPLALVSPGEIGAGQASHAIASETCAIPGDQADGLLPIAVHLETLDANGLVSVRDITLPDRLRVDSTPPSAVGVLFPPAPRCCVPPEAPAARNADTVTSSISVQDADPATGQSTFCSGCVRDLAVVQYADESCGQPVDAPAIAIASGGTSYAGSYHAATRGIRFHIDVRDEAGNAGTGNTSCLPVDNVPPRAASATIVPGAGGERRVLRVMFTECVATASSPLPQLDWSPLPVQTARIDENGCTKGVTLTYLQDFAANPGQLAYAPFALSSRPSDRVGLQMPDHSVPIT